MASHLSSWKATAYCSVTFKAHSPPASYWHSQLDKKGIKTAETLFSGISHARPMTQDATSQLLSFSPRTFESLLQVGAPRNPSHLLKLLDISSPRSVSQTIRQSHLVASHSHFSLVGSLEQVSTSWQSTSWFPLADTHDQHRNPDSGSRAWKKHGMGPRVTFSLTHAELTLYNDCISWTSWSSWLSCSAAMFGSIYQNHTYLGMIKSKRNPST